MKTYPKGQTIDLGPFTLRDSAGTLTDASSTVCAVLKPDGTTASVGLTRTSTGTYSAKLTVDQSGVWTAEAKLTVGSQTAVLVDSFRVNPSPLDAAASPTTTYTTPALLRAELDVDPNDLSDTDATRLIVQAEDIVDRLLGAWEVDETTGRKVTPADCEGWQWAKLQRATVLLARHLHEQPDDTGSWQRVKGPDFEFEGPRSSALPARVLTPLDDSGLRRLSGIASTRVKTGVAPREWYQGVSWPPDED